MASGFSSACVDGITQFSSLRPFSIHDEADRTLYHADMTVQVTDVLTRCDVSPTTIHRATAKLRMRYELPETGENRRMISQTIEQKKARGRDV